MKGNTATLRASHPGNTNAVRHGVYSQRVIGARAREVEAGLREAYDVSAVDGLVVSQAARLQALLEAIDCDVDQRGLLDRKGKPHPLLSYQLRILRHYESAIATLAAALAHPAPEQPPEAPTPAPTVPANAFGRDGKPINIAAELEDEIRSVKPNAVRVSALVALDRIRRQPPTDDGDVPNRVVQVFD